MTDTSLLTVLHISDFHFTRRKYVDQRTVVEALEKDLQKLCIGHRRPDVIIFSGDLVNAAGPDSHEDAYDNILAKVAKATGCSDDRIFISPGNHDLARIHVQESRDQHRIWREAAKDTDSLNDLYYSADLTDTIRKKFEGFFQLDRYLSENSVKYRNHFVTVYRIEHINIDIISINTAALSTGGLAGLDPDEGNLAVPEHAILESMASLTEGSYKIYVTHHPLEMLNQDNENLLRRLIESNGDMHLFGHMHSPVPRNLTSSTRNVFSNQSGAIFTHRHKSHIGYALISFCRVKKHYETHVRTYFSDRMAFEKAIDKLDDGKFYSSAEAKKFWGEIGTPVDLTTFRAFLYGPCLADFNAEIEASDADREVHQKFVPPPMKRTVIQATSTDGTKAVDETSVPFDKLLRDDGNFIIYALAEHGRTTVLKEMAFQTLTNAKELRFPRLPIMVDFEDIKYSANQLKRLIKSRAPSLPNGIEFDSLLNLGYVCILFDDVSFSDTRRMSILREFVHNYPKPRYIFSSAASSAAPHGAHVNPEMPIHFDFVELRPLRRKEMRELVAKLNRGTDIDTVLDKLHSEFMEINIPFTAANCTILMTIYDVNNGFSPINRSVLIEQFVDATLKKASVDQSRRETFDYSNKTNLLAHIASWMAKNNDYTPEMESVRNVIKSYLDLVGLNAPVDQLFSEFLSARIFVKRPEQRMSFRYRSVLEYFIALQMFYDDQFRDWIMEECRYLQYGNEIQYYSGKKRNDLPLLNEIGIRFGAICADLDADSRPIDLKDIQSHKLPRKNEELMDDLLESYLERPLSKEERDAEIEADLPQDVENRQEVFRPEIKDPGHKLLLSLILYSGVVKNMELIDNASKQFHLKNIWLGWSLFWLLSLMVVPEIARHRRFRLNGVLYEYNAPQALSDSELARSISLNIPTGISKFVFATLGTEKLERQLTEPSLEDHEEPLSFEFLRTSLIADLKLPSTPGAIKSAIERLKSSPYLSESLIWKIASLRRMNDISQSHMNSISGHIAAAIADINGVKNEKKSSEKRRIIEKMKHENILFKIKRMNE